MTALSMLRKVFQSGPKMQLREVDSSKVGAQVVVVGLGPLKLKINVQIPVLQIAETLLQMLSSTKASRPGILVLSENPRR